MNKFIGFLTLGGVGLYFWSKNPQITPLIPGMLTIGGVIPAILVPAGYQGLRDRL